VNETAFSPASTWSLPYTRAELGPGEVHVWRLALDIPGDAARRLLSILSPGERARADSFHFNKDRLAFIAARSALRRILGAYLGADPARLRFSYSDHGKPYLDETQNPCQLHFNLSHSHHLGLIAFHRGGPLGVDIEYMRSDLALEELARRCFSPREYEALRALPPEQQMEAFFTCWARKEAYIKAHGMGLSLPLDSFDVSLAPGSPAVLLETRPDPGEASRWSLRALQPGPGYAAALAVRGEIRSLHCLEWEESG